MLTTIYHAVNAVLLLVLVAMTVEFIVRGRDLGDAQFQMRRKAFAIFFVLMAANVVTSPLMFRPEGIEIYCTIPICTLYFASSVFMVMSAAHFGRLYYRNIFIWFLVLQYGAILLGVSIVCQVVGVYEPLYCFSDLMRVNSNFYIYGRVFFLLIIISLWIMLLLMVVEAYIYSLRSGKYESCEYHARPQQTAETASVFAYMAVLTMGMVAYFVPSVAMHLVWRILLLAALLRSNTIYNRYLKEVVSLENERKVFRQIAEKVEKLLETENGNPIYKSNNNIEEIADVLGVSRNDLSEYIYCELNTTFAAWVSEKKLLHCAEQIAETDRKISEIAYLTGYMDLPAMSKAFKKRFGISPTEYRKRRSKGKY